MGTVAQTRDRLTADFMGAKAMVVDMKELVAQGQTGGLGMNPP
jgi:hypothetical protein